MRTDEDTEAAVRRRLAHLVGAQPTGWTPAQPPGAGGEGDWRERWRVSAQQPALRWLLLAGAAVILVTALLLSRHHAAAAVPPPARAAPIPVATPSTVQIVVDVGGRVRHPGLVSLANGARVADAIAAAGGALRPSDLATLNLAARVTDGQLLLIGVPGAAIGAAGASGAGAGPVDLNSATVDQLDALPGVGPVLAQRIIDWRQQHGGFRSVDDLQQVPGIGARKFADLKSLVVA
ncbi:MAG TPA: ComEA family DNA-binding protein [Mycobacteriales bacterium]|nr:ComEA family DNA-binding protein [Mycobacteriales bacterium]